MNYSRKRAYQSGKMRQSAPLSYKREKYIEFEFFPRFTAALIYFSLRFSCGWWRWKNTYKNKSFLALESWEINLSEMVENLSLSFRFVAAIDCGAELRRKKRLNEEKRKEAGRQEERKSSRRWRLIMVTIEHAFIIKTMSKALRGYRHDTIGGNICRLTLWVQLRSEFLSLSLSCCWVWSSYQELLDYLLKISSDPYREPNIESRRFLSQSGRIV